MSSTDILTVSDAQTSLGVTGSEGDLQDYVSAATAIVEDITGPVIQRSVSETFDGGQLAVILKYPVVEVTTVTENGVTVDSTGYTATAGQRIMWRGGQTLSLAWAVGRQNVTVAYTAGIVSDYSSVPANLRLAARELVRVWWQVGRQGNRPGFGDAPDDTVYTPSGYAVSPRIEALCHPHRLDP